MDAEQFRRAAQSAVEDIIQHFNTLPSRRVIPDIEPGYLRPLIPQSAPTEPETWEQIQQDIDSQIKPGLTHWQSPHFMAFFPALTTYPSMLELEIVVLDWVAQVIGLPGCFHSSNKTGGGGVIQGSASEAVVTVMVAARERMLRDLAAAKGLKEDTPEWEDEIMSVRGSLVALGSDQAHSCTAKGARIVGTRYRSVPTSLEENFEMTGASLRKVLEECETAGLVPYYITTTMGTTSTCATDRFAEIKAVLASKPSWQKIWVHIDAAFAGAALITPEHQPIADEWSSGIDSFNFNMHKWLLVNFDASCLFVRARTDLTSAMDITPAYLRNPYSDRPDTVDFRNWQIPLGRRFRALKIWLVMRVYGVTAMRAFIYKGLHHGDVFSKLFRSRTDLFTIVTPPAYGLTVFRVSDDSAAAVGSTSAAISQQLYETINANGDIFITSSVVGGIYVIRVVSASLLSEEKYVREAFDIIVRTTEETLLGTKTGGPSGLDN
ncbi:hypothetical protein LOZ12_003432 [Ophidiomyces ophidiicola]|uniref:Uncharacterized protein n=1 Tax=Ophidiomyces ophidiicola TaxID=1387563 RepID=A0ACB8UV27_9EURO|nr:uncharacterized protein LOZ57_004014 [Ophidiomyces ophidiicola]KAI1914936.1 hypothetical protein LOZ64_003711 [Ophidiomyces ophidiicola]KAI1928011.1 hypothetical protein LOZ60_002632 [Ophidiomyces ophidiicola]KAI1945763.1 hypothetical protein LOZ57_004014 [Ophidiomyces ophidiicola]KAI1964326.1 hypothetical protein LOZ59_001629 [Ophidiomyces ophidiicola]KAI2005089.1 hypothetical protein LOZ49_005559 [Ophidiomyces ophidiicola]